VFPHICNDDTCEIEYLIYFSIGLAADEICSWYEKIFHDNPDGRLNRLEFRKFFRLLRQEPPERLENICDHVFRAFDVDGNGYVDFGEFLLGFAICSRGDLRSRLDYAFECYDLDSNGYITEGILYRKKKYKLSSCFR
jgi:Ca2+-binding EF-hand superfamily protein